MFGYGSKVNETVFDVESLAQSNSQKSLWRRWNSLSRFQKNLMFLIMMILFAVFLLFGMPGRDIYAFPGPSINTEEDSSRIGSQINYPNASGRFQGPLGPPVGERKNGGRRSDSKDIRPLTREEEEGVVPGPLPEIEDKIYDRPPTLTFSGPKNEKQQAVVNAFRHAWKGYRDYAWGHDHLKPISKTYHDWFGLKLTMIDSLDTMYIMGLNDEFDEARIYLRNNLKLDVNRDVNVFETTIRVMGGLLSTYHLSGDDFFLEKALDLGNRLMPAFNTAWGVPWADINLNTHKAHPPTWNSDSTTSEVTTIQIEFCDLSRSTGIDTFEGAVKKVSEHFHTLEKKDGLVPIFISPLNGEFRKHAAITLGARGDSYYEYLLKQWIQTGRTRDYLKDDYVESVAGMQKHLFRRSGPNKLLFAGELASGGTDFRPKMDHLVCFLPGTLALGTLFGMPSEHLKLAEELAYTCYSTYTAHPTGLAPEITHFNLQDDASSDFLVKPNDAHNLLRPETIESLWYLYYITGNSTYQDWAWNIFQSFEKYTKVDHGYTSVGNVRSTTDLKPRDMMESFFLGETLKYFYLVFAENGREGPLDLTSYVFNSEAHPLPIYDS